jgi:hypothetical protein
MENIEPIQPSFHLISVERLGVNLQPKICIGNAQFSQRVYENTGAQRFCQGLTMTMKITNSVVVTGQTIDFHSSRVYWKTAMRNPG